MKFIIKILIITTLCLHTQILATDGKYKVSIDVFQDKDLSYFNGEEQQALKGQDNALTSIKSILRNEDDINIFLLNKKNKIKNILNNTGPEFLKKLIIWLIDYRASDFIKELLEDEVKKEDRFTFILPNLIDNHERYKKRELLKISENTENRSKDVIEFIITNAFFSEPISFTPSLWSKEEAKKLFAIWISNKKLNPESIFEYALDNQVASLIELLLKKLDKEIIFKNGTEYYIKNFKNLYSGNEHTKKIGAKNLEILKLVISSYEYIDDAKVTPDFALVDLNCAKIAAELDMGYEEKVWLEEIEKFLNFFGLLDKYIEYKLEDKNFLSDTLDLSLPGIKFVNYYIKKTYDQNIDLWQLDIHIELICKKENKFFYGVNKNINLRNLLYMIQNSSNKQGYEKVLKCLQEKGL